jgi:putative inorganic carbon (HCO3(-)) transporter
VAEPTRRSSRGRPSARTLACLLFVLTLGLALFSGQWSRLGIPVPLDRACLAASMVCFLASDGGRRRWGQVFRGQQVRVWLFGLLALWTTLSAFWAGTLLERDPLFALADRVVVPLVLFFYAPLVVRTGRDFHLLLVGLTVFGAYLGFTAVMAAVGPSALVFPRYVADASVGLAVGRARGPSAEAVGTGVDLVVLGAAAGLLALRSRRVGRWAGAAVGLLCFVAAFMTFTRSVWLGAVLAIVVTAVKFARFRRVVGAGLAALVALLVLVLAAVPGVLASVTGRAGTTRSVSDRQYTYEAAIDMLRAHPVSGVGWGRFLDHVSEYVWQAETGPITNVHIEAHNIVLARGAELGVPGLVLIVACVVVGPLAVLRARESSDRLTAQVQVLATVAVCAWFAAAMLSPMSYPLPNALAWGFAGLALLQVRLPAGPEQRPGPARSTAVASALR